MPRTKPAALTLLSPDTEVLTEPQTAALDALCAGLTDAQAATAAGVSEAQIIAWRTQDAPFLAAYNRRQRRAWEARHARLHVLADTALDTLASLLMSDDPAVRLKAAVVVLKAAALETVEPPSTDVTPEDVTLSWQIAESERRTRALLAL